MSIFSKLITLVKGTASDVGESIIDANATKILDQEIRDAKENLSKAKNELTNIMAERMGEERTLNGLNESITEHEDYVANALDQGNEDLALEIAEKIAEFESQRDASSAILGSHKQNVTTLKKTIRQAEKNIKAIEREVSMVKATESVNKAQQASTSAKIGSNSATMKATDSLARIKARQQKHADKMKAASDLASEEDGDLNQKLQDAGIISSKSKSSDVLARIKAKSKK